MKRIKIIAILMSLIASVSARAGWEDENAGDIYCAEFILTGRDIVQRLKYLGDLGVPGLDADALNGVILATKVRSEERAYMRDGSEVDAVNHPLEKLIKINRTRWQEYRDARFTSRRLLLVLHEFLFIAKFDDTGYRISEALMARLNVDNYNPGKWWNPLNPVNQITLDLEYTTRGCSLPQIQLDPARVDEIIEVETDRGCKEEFRRVRVEKTARASAPESGFRGIYHHYSIQVMDIDGQVIGQMSYEPVWGQCLLPQDGTCRLSGELETGGVVSTFWFLRNQP